MQNNNALLEEMDITMTQAEEQSDESGIACAVVCCCAVATICALGCVLAEQQML